MARKTTKTRKSTPKATAKSKTKPVVKPGKPTKPSIFEHQKHCTICKHPQRKEIERRYHQGYSANMTATEFKVGRRSLDTHVIAFGLADKRDYTTLAACAKLIRTEIFLSDGPYNHSLVGKALELQAKLKDGLVDRHKHDHVVKVLDLREHLAKKLANAHSAMRKAPPTEAEITEAVEAASEDSDDAS